MESSDLGRSAAVVSPEYGTRGVGRWDGYQEVRLDALNLWVQIVQVMKLRTDINSSLEQLPWRWSRVADGHVDLKHKKCTTGLGMCAQLRGRGWSRREGSGSSASTRVEEKRPAAMVHGVGVCGQPGGSRALWFGGKARGGAGV